MHIYVTLIVCNPKGLLTYETFGKSHVQLARSYPDFLELFYNMVSWFEFKVVTLGDGEI